MNVLRPHAVHPLMDMVEMPQAATLIAAGPLTKQPATMAYRIVLVSRCSGDYVVWKQYFSNYPDIRKSHYESGSYFKPDEFSVAAAEFGRRVTDDARFYDSLYRDDAGV